MIKSIAFEKGRIFQANVNGIACERFFYQLQDLTSDEIQLVERFFSDHPSESLKAAQKNFLSIYFRPVLLKKTMGAETPQRIREALDRIIREGEEDYHQKIEDDLLVFLRSMLAGDTSFYSDGERAARFLHAICVQYTRTKQIRESAAKWAAFPGCNVRRIMGVLAPLMAMALAHGLYIDRENFKLVVVRNDTDTPFITGDQPIINLHHSLDGKLPSNFELYYPLSPRKAMLLLELASRHDESPLSAVSINSYNAMIFKNSHEQVFSNSKEYLNCITISSEF